MSNSPTAAQASAASTASFLTSLWLNAAIGGGELLAFTLIRQQFRTIYEPRTFIPEKEEDRSPPMSKHILGWPLALWKADIRDITHKNGHDAYVFMRYIRMMIKILIPIWIISWLILMPINAVGTSVDGKNGLDRFTFGHVGRNDQIRYVAHLLCAWLFTFWIFYNIQYEMRLWLASRQLYLVSEEHSSLPQSRTVLVTGVPKSYLDETRLQQLFHHLPGGVEHVWLNRDLKEMPELYANRLKASQKLESSQTQLIKTALKLRRKEEKASKKNGKSLDDSTWATASQEESDVSLAERLVPAKNRPTHRLPPSWFFFGLPFTGKKVDTIDWCKEEIVKNSEALALSREQLKNDIASPGVGDDEVYPPLNSAFLLFKQQIAAHMAVQSTSHHKPYAMADRYVEMHPKDVIWSNLGLNPYEAKIRQAVSYGLTAGLIILWAFPVAFVGLLSNVASLCSKYSWMAWMCELPKTVQGLIQGVLPPILLALLFILLPIILRLLAKFEGIPKRTGVELSLMTRYMIFLTIHGFLIVTLSAGLVKSLPLIAKDPSSIATILAENLPSASTFFLTFILLKGITGAASNFIQYISLLIYWVKLILLGSTPRSAFKVRFEMRRIDWGTVFPDTSLLSIITIAYMIISPIINGLACFSFTLLFFAYKYLFIWVMDQDSAFETGGLFFPKAISHLFVGCYIGEICLAALFFLARDTQGKASAIPEGALMVVLVVLTIGFQLIINNSYAPLIHNLPLSLAHKSYGMPHEEGHDDTIDETQALLDQDFGASDGAPEPRRSSISGRTDASGAHINSRPFIPAGSGAPDEQDMESEAASPAGRTASFNAPRFEATVVTPQLELPPHSFQLEATNSKQPTVSPGSPKRGLSSDDAERVEPDEEQILRRRRSRIQSYHSGVSASSPPAVVVSDFVNKESHIRDPSIQRTFSDGPSNTGKQEQTQERHPVDEDEDEPEDGDSMALDLAFAHPATHCSQQTIWVPQDPLGLAKEAVRSMRERGIAATSRDAYVTAKGKVVLEGPPPPEGRPVA